MKKWTKTALLTGCACCIAGVVLMFSGWASGGKGIRCGNGYRASACS